MNSSQMTNCPSLFVLTALDDWIRSLNSSWCCYLYFTSFWLVRWPCCIVLYSKDTFGSKCVSTHCVVDKQIKENFDEGLAINTERLSCSVCYIGYVVICIPPPPPYLKISAAKPLTLYDFSLTWFLHKLGSRPHCCIRTQGFVLNDGNAECFLVSVW